LRTGKGEKDKLRRPLWTIVIGLLFFFVGLPCNVGIAPAGAIAAGKVKKLLFPCRAHASDHSGRYPENLSEWYHDSLEIENFLSVSGRWGRLFAKSPFVKMASQNVSEVGAWQGVKFPSRPNMQHHSEAFWPVSGNIPSVTSKPLTLK
jgi:hypothetical protein